jgi:hypothetical protein
MESSFRPVETGVSPSAGPRTARWKRHRLGRTTTSVSSAFAGLDSCHDLSLEILTHANVHQVRNL